VEKSVLRPFNRRSKSAGDLANRESGRGNAGLLAYGGRNYDIPVCDIQSFNGMESGVGDFLDRLEVFWGIRSAKIFQKRCQ